MEKFIFCAVWIKKGESCLPPILFFEKGTKNKTFLDVKNN